MRKFICLAAVCLLFSCSNDADNLTNTDTTALVLQQEFDKANQNMTDYITEITNDKERRKKYVEQVNQKPGDEEWRLECFRNHYKEFSGLMTSVKEADLKLNSYRPEEKVSQNSND
ncbi:MAG: hypothetical protein P1U56_10720 [Saprospiraceae bacterium]|nr:hypothetical protein [Saprospiraceae bacterium]